MVRKAVEMCLRVLKERNKSRFDRYSRQKQCIDNIPYYLSGLRRARFSDNLSRNSCIWLNVGVMAGNRDQSKKSKKVNAFLLILMYFYSFSLFPSNETYLPGRSKTRFDPLRNQKTTGHGFFSRSKWTLQRKINNSRAFRCFLSTIPPEFSLLIFSLFFGVAMLMIKSRGLNFIYLSTCFCRWQL